MTHGQPAMSLALYRTSWGVDEPWDTFFPRVAADGFAGVEAPLIHLQRHDPRGDLLRRNGLRAIPMIFTAGDTVDAHVRSFREQVDDALAYAPPVITCHSGVDGWSEAESTRFLEAALDYEAGVSHVAVAHETHRGRIFYNPWTTARMLDRFDALRLCCDFSHWVCVCERLIDDQMTIVEHCAERAAHVHARVGYPQGPQVPDPAAPAYADALAAHERWWEAIWTAKRRRRLATSTCTPEFGPPPYLHTSPVDESPAADLERVCLWMAHRLRDRFRQHATIV